MRALIAGVLLVVFLVGAVTTALYVGDGISRIARMGMPKTWEAIISRDGQYWVCFVVSFIIGVVTTHLFRAH